VLLGGCAGVADVTGTATQQDIAQVRAEMATVQQSASRGRADTERLLAQVEARTREQSAERDRQAAELSRRVDGLSASLAALTARLDDLNGRVEALSRQPRAGVAPPPAAIAPKPVAPPAATGTPPATATPTVPAAPPIMPPPPITGPPPATGTPPATAGARPSTEGLQPQDIYQAAYIDFSKGSYALAMAGFREFLRRYPEHPLAGNAQYWLGEAQFSLARSYANAGEADRAREALEQAVQEFRKVIANYPRGDKAPTALYKEALALIDLKQPAVAQQRLQYLVDNFPQAAEAPLAREQLATLKQ
jgi:tol-pal system protein YbgF